MARLKQSSYLRFFLLTGFLLLFSACSTIPSGQTIPPINPSIVPSSITSPKCSSKYGSAYQTILPDSTYTQTNVYAKVLMPPLTRSYDDDATGHRYRFLCSAGASTVVLTFMQTSLATLGWSKQPSSSCFAVPGYTTHQCWQIGSYQLSLDLNSNLDWLIEYTDPAFLCGGSFSGSYQATLPDSTYSETTLYANIQLPPQTLSYNDDATGHRVRFMCSSTTDNVQTFMHNHLTGQGWTKDATIDCFTVPSYKTQECWKNGKYALALDINSNLDWVVEYTDPAFLS